MPIKYKAKTARIERLNAQIFFYRDKCGHNLSDAFIHWLKENGLLYWGWPDRPKYWSPSGLDCKGTIGLILNV